MIDKEKIIKEIEKEEHKVVKSIRNNPWIAVSIVLGILIIVLLIITFKGGVSVKAISSDDASKKLIDFNPSCIHAIESFKNYTYGKDEKPQAGQNDHAVEATSYSASAVSMWWMDLSLPKYGETLVEKELTKAKLGNSEGFDPIYGRQYAGNI